MAWSLIEADVKKCTKALAKKFAEMLPAPHDRNFRPSIAGHLKKAIENNKFRLADFASVNCEATGETYRVNGKHTSTVLNEMNGEFPSELWAVVEHYRADTLEDVAGLYATFDHSKSVRRRGDINKAFAASHPDLAEIPAKIIDSCAAGIGWSLWEIGQLSKDAEECASLLIANPQFVMWAYFILKGDSSKLKHLYRKSVLAAMFKTFCKHQKAATEFWEMVRDESHPKNTHPTRRLAKHLLTHSIRHRDERSSTCDTPQGMYVRCIHAWNAFRDGTTTDLKFYPSSKTPAVK